MSNSGIKNMGKLAEKRFCDITGATDDIPAKVGDVKLSLPEGGHIIGEIKGPTLNQVRPSHYLPHAAPISPPGKQPISDDFWRVLSAVDVIKECYYKNGSQMKAGQHTPNPMSVVGLGDVRNLTHGKVVKKENLKEAFIQAYREGEENLEAKEYAAKCLAAEQRLVQKVHEHGMKLRSKLFD